MFQAVAVNRVLIAIYQLVPRTPSLVHVHVYYVYVSRMLSTVFVCVGGSRYRPRGSDGLGMGPSDIGGAADPLTGIYITRTCKASIYTFAHAQ